MEQEEKSVTAHDKQCKLYIISSEKSLNKQQRTTTKNPEEGGEWNLQSCQIKVFSSKNKKVWDTKKQENMAYTQEKKHSIKSVPE